MSPVFECPCTKTKRLACAFDPWFCVHREALWCQRPSQREKSNHCHMQEVPMLCSYSTQPISGAVILDKIFHHFWRF